MGARLHAAAPQSEADRGRARARPVAGAARAADRRGADDGARGAARQPRHVRVLDRHRSAERRGVVRVHRGEPAAASGAHRHRSGDRRRSGRRAAAPRARRDARRAGAAACRRRCRAASRCKRASTWRRSCRRRRAAGERNAVACSSRRPGPGVRVDTFGYGGYRTNPSFDSLLAKVVVHAPDGDFAHAAAFAARTLREFRIAGVATNLPFLSALLRRPDVADVRRVHALRRGARARARRGFADTFPLARAADCRRNAASRAATTVAAAPNERDQRAPRAGRARRRCARRRPGKCCRSTSRSATRVARGQRFAVARSDEDGARAHRGVVGNRARDRRAAGRDPRRAATRCCS